MYVTVSPTFIRQKVLATPNMLDTFNCPGSCSESLQDSVLSGAILKIVLILLRFQQRSYDVIICDMCEIQIRIQRKEWLGEAMEVIF